MITPSEIATAGTKSPETKLPRSTKKSIWWKRGEHLVQHTPTGTFYARIKVKGKLFRASLETDVLTTARLRLPDKVKELRKPKAEFGTFAEARALYAADINADHTLAPKSRIYRLGRITALLRTWPKLDAVKIEKITVSECKEWAQRFSNQFSNSNFNNTLGTLRAIIERGGIGKDANPARKIKRLGQKPKVLQLPEPTQFDKLLETLENGGGRFSKGCADFVRFLTFSGCRLSEARQVAWADVDFDRGEIKVHNAKRAKTKGHSEFRFVPVIPAMRQLLERLRCENPHEPADRVCVLGECEKSLTRACKIIGISRITHHDLRHLFASACIESGVDIPTVSRWLGHVDGGVLAMKVYGHLRRTHSQQQAQLVTFGTQPLPDNAVPMIAVENVQR